MDKILLVGIIVVVIMSAMYLFSLINNRISMNKKEVISNSNIIKWPRSIIIIGGLGILFIVLIWVYIIFILKEEQESVFIFIPFLILMIIIIMYGVNVTIIINNEEVIYKNIYGKKTLYTFDELDIESYKAGTKALKNGKKVFFISYLMINWSVFEEEFEKHTHSVKK